MNTVCVSSTFNKLTDDDDDDDDDDDGGGGGGDEYVCVCVHSDVLCGSLFCDVSAISDPQKVNYLRGRIGYWTLTYGGVQYLCRYAYYRTFYNGPDRIDPGFVPNGASCGTGKVAVFDK